MAEAILFATPTPLGFPVRVARSRWELIVGTKHPAMRGAEERVRTALSDPDVVRRSRSDENVYLFYRLERPGRWVCAVVRSGEDEGFLVTAYPTDAIKVGQRVWSK